MKSIGMRLRVNGLAATFGVSPRIAPIFRR